VQAACLSYQFIGKSGLKVSELALGPHSVTFVDPRDEETFMEILDIYAEAGGNHLDLSSGYPGAEERVGRWLRGKPRDRFVIASKVGFPKSDDPNCTGLSRKNIMRTVDQSLRDLNTDYIDLYYPHLWDGGTPLEETLSVFDDLVHAGKVRYLGVCNFMGWQLQKAVDIAQYTGKAPIICLQTQYNALDRYPEWEQIPVCRREGLSVMAWGPLASGWLSGKYRRGMKASEVGARVRVEESYGMTHNSFAFRNHERTWRTIEAIVAIAEELGTTPPQVALNWLRSKPGVNVILGPRQARHLHEALGAVGWRLSDEHCARLDQASELPGIMPNLLINAVHAPDRR
jgi:aryl-alcohol dehydrogenase-like predicted oxidoreductase